jgi:hypothetical protein
MCCKFVRLNQCRLFHLSYEDTKALLKNFIDSNTSYLLTTSHMKLNNYSNYNIKTSDFRLIDLFSAPYNFPQETLLRIEDWRKPDPMREMCLWNRKQIVAVYNNLNI